MVEADGDFRRMIEEKRVRAAVELPPGADRRFAIEAVSFAVHRGETVAIVGESPVMEAQLVKRSDENAFSTVNLFETVVAPLVNAQRPESFVF